MTKKQSLDNVLEILKTLSFGEPEFQNKLLEAIVLLEKASRPYKDGERLEEAWKETIETRKLPKAHSIKKK